MIENNSLPRLPRCQMHSILDNSEELSLFDASHLSFGKSIKLFIKRMIGPYRARSIKRTVTNTTALITGKKELDEKKKPVISIKPLNLASGEWVRVKSEAAIKETLDEWNELRGCAYLPEMNKFCNSIQNVRKPIMRFVDERDYRVKKASGVVLLEGVNCQGTEFYGGCDRSCFFFWREEWLERLENEKETSKG